MAIRFVATATDCLVVCNVPRIVLEWVQVAILVEDVTCRMEEASAPQLASVQGRLADGVVSALACAEDPLALQAAGAHVVKASLSRLVSSRQSAEQRRKWSQTGTG